MPKREKMSKSRGNVVGVDEVVYGVARLDDGYEFRDMWGDVVDCRKFHIWQDKAGDGCFRMGSRWQKGPVFLCEKGNPAPCILLINGEEVIQHPKEQEWVMPTEKELAEQRYKAAVSRGILGSG